MWACRNGARQLTGKKSRTQVSGLHQKQHLLIGRHAISFCHLSKLRIAEHDHEDTIENSMSHNVIEPHAFQSFVMSGSSPT
ncbi:hypothetical protein EB815_20385 [Mesorhizobium loti]|nr:hypothetical protein EB815_20385 [Mesorhizobium loti]